MQGTTQASVKQWLGCSRQRAEYAPGVRDDGPKVGVDSQPAWQTPHKRRGTVRGRHAPRKEAMVKQKKNTRHTQRYKVIGELGAMANAAWAAAVCLSTSLYRRTSLCMELLRWCLTLANRPLRAQTT